jgi:hypothetical protein
MLHDRDKITEGGSSLIRSQCDEGSLTSESIIGSTRPSLLSLNKMYTFDSIHSLLGRDEDPTHKVKRNNVIGRKQGQRGKYLMKKLEDLTYEELLDMYICGCGKVYSSRDNLSVHIKTKHQGVRPAGSLSSF